MQWVIVETRAHLPYQTVFHALNARDFWCGLGKHSVYKSRTLKQGHTQRGGGAAGAVAPPPPPEKIKLAIFILL